MRGLTAAAGVIVVSLVVTSGDGRATITDRQQAYREAQQILDGGVRFVDFDKQQMALFWNCVMSGEVDIGMFQSVDQLQQRIESAYYTNSKTYPEHLTTDCTAALEAARIGATKLLRGMPEVLKPPLKKYVAAMSPMGNGLASYAEKLKSRAPVTDVDRSIREVGEKFTPEPTAESVAFERFMACAIPDLGKKPDIQAVLEYMAEVCKSDPVTFMERVRSKCGPLVQNLNKGGKPMPSKTFSVNARKFYEDDQRQLQAWEWCGRKSRKGKKVLDLEAFLLAAGDHIEARGEVVKTAREEAARITGQPLPAEKKKSGEPGADEAPAAAAKPAKK
jgi:hypothetical protein